MNNKILRKLIREQLNVISTEESLRNKLLSIGGHSVKFGMDSEQEQQRMLLDGKVYLQKVKFIKGGMPNQCHRNIADLSKRNLKNNFKIINGYVLYDGQWISHSWGFYKNEVIETTKIKFSVYFGYELSLEESQEFCFTNY